MEEAQEEGLVNDIDYLIGIVLKRGACPRTQADLVEILMNG